jgi:phage FluMu protein Com
MDCPRCGLKEMDKLFKYNKNASMFDVRIGCPRCKTIWVGVLIEDIHSNDTQLSQYYGEQSWTEKALIIKDALAKKFKGSRVQ